MSKNYGFARCSLGEEKGQDLNRQVRELKAAGAEEIITERVHGDAKVKPQLDFLLEHIEPNSSLYVTEVSRLSRSTQQLCAILNTIKEKRLRLVILNSVTIDCRNGEIDAMSMAFLQMAGVFSELELSMIRARVRSGMANAKAKGKQIGRKPVTKADLPAAFIKHYPNFGDLPIDSITVDRVQDFMLLEADNGKAKASINRIMQLLTQIMDSAVEDELIIKNPCKSKRLYNPSEKQCKVLPYSPGVYKQMERLLPLLPTDTDKLYLGLSMYAGLRQGEIVALRWENVDFDLGFIHVRRAIQYAAKNVGTIKPPKTDNGVRDIPMMRQLRAILEALRKDEGFIICGQRGADKDLPMTQQMVRNMDIRVNKFFAEHGIKEPFKSHRMRHTVLTLLNNSRLADDKSLQAWAGHRDAAFTRRQYMTPQEEQLQTVGNGFSEYISSLL